MYHQYVETNPAQALPQPPRPHPSSSSRAAAPSNMTAATGTANTHGNYVDRATQCVELIEQLACAEHILFNVLENLKKDATDTISFFGREYWRTS